jgi:phage gp46-like protein
MIALLEIGKDGYSDIALDDDGLLSLEGGLDTPVLISLFTNKRARPSDNRDKPEGWWGDTYPEVPGDQIGSHLWLRARSNLTTETLRYCMLDADDALAWMIEDGLANEINVTTERTKTGFLALGVSVKRPVGGNWDRLWKVHLDAL